MVEVSKMRCNHEGCIMNLFIEFLYLRDEFFLFTNTSYVLKPKAGPLKINMFL